MKYNFIIHVLEYTWCQIGNIKYLPTLPTLFYDINTNVLNLFAHILVYLNIYVCSIIVNNIFPVLLNQTVNLLRYLIIIYR